MAKSAERPDDNELRKRGAFRGYFDGVEPTTDDAPRSTPAPAEPAPKLEPPGEASAKVALALRSPARIVAIRSTPGAGKSREVRLMLAELVGAGQCAVMAVPTHALAGQTVAELAMLGVRASAPMGVTRPLLPVLNDQGETSLAKACLHAEAAELLIQSKTRIRQEMCPYCPEQDNYRGQGGECPAYAAGSRQAPVLVVQQGALASVLRDHTARLLGPPPEKASDRAAEVFIVDEGLPPTTCTALAGVRLAYQRLRAGQMTDATRRDIEPLLFAFFEGLERAKMLGRKAATMREVLSFAGDEPGDENGEQRLAWARRADGSAIWVPGVQEALAQQALKRPNDPAVRAQLEQLAVLTAFVEALVDGAFNPDRPALQLRQDGSWHLVTWARWARYALSYVEAGGRLRWLDATARPEVLRALWGEAFDFVQVDVRDASRVVRRYMQWQRGARGRHVISDQADPRRLPGPLRQIANAATERAAKEVVIITDKPTANGLRAWLAGRADGAPTPAMIPTELVAFVDQGGVLHVGHYGAQRGLDTWAHCDVLATLGDPWPDLGAAQAEALALGIDPDEHALALARAELLQAWGRARTVHRQTPVLVMHLGARKLTPDASWAPQWVAVPTEVPPPHRPRSVRPSTDPATWAADRAARGLSARQHAAELAMSWGSYCRLSAEAARRPVTKTPEAPKEAPANPAENGSTKVAHNWALHVSEYGSSVSSDLSSLIATYGPPETPTKPGLAGFKNDPTSQGADSPSPRRLRADVTVAFAPPSGRTSTAGALDPPARGGVLVA